MAMSSSSSGGGDEPMMDINTTPLIDVMLVLLIMLIVTLPPPTHAVKIDLPQDCQPNCPPKPPKDPVKNTVYIAPNGAVTWNGSPIDDRTLLDLLKETTTMEPVPELHFQPDPEAPYDVVHRILKLTKIADISKMGFIGNETYRGF
jgi:biopolymer transport protein ExbD